MSKVLKRSKPSVECCNIPPEVPPFLRRSLELLLAYHYQSYVLEIIYTHLTLEEKMNALVCQRLLLGPPKTTLM